MLLSEPATGLLEGALLLACRLLEGWVLLCLITHRLLLRHSWVVAGVLSLVGIGGLVEIVVPVSGHILRAVRFVGHDESFLKCFAGMCENELLRAEELGLVYMRMTF